MTPRTPIVALGALLLSTAPAWTTAGRAAGQAPQSADEVMWLAPTADEVAARADLARAVADLASGNAAAALPVFQMAAADPAIGGYAALFTGRAELALGKASEAGESARTLAAASPGTVLGDAAQILAADAAEAAGDWPALVAALQPLVTRRTGAGRPGAAVLMRLGRAAEAAGDKPAAIAAYAQVHYEFALSTDAADAAASWTRLTGRPLLASRESLALDLARAERFYGGRRYTDARKAFEPLRALTSGDERSLVDLRLAECDFFLKRYTSARDALRAYIDRSDARPSTDSGRSESVDGRTVEAQFFYLGTLRELGRHDEYAALVAEFVDRYPSHPLAESALNDLGTHFILANEDGQAAAVFADQYTRYPTGAYADRAAWKAGWWAYKSGEYGEAIRIFESAAATLRRADYRPSWLYWTARAHVKLGHRDLALEAYRQVLADYRNSYYGREASAELEQILATMRPEGGGPVEPASRVAPRPIRPDAPPANAALVRTLLAAGMYDEAIAELRAARDIAPSGVIDATIAYALSRKGDLRPAITAMRRAYPQFMADGGETLPVEILQVIFPVEYWDLIHEHARARNLDPFLMMALIAQESTFQADVRSAANAYGLMQVVPATGRRYAQTLGIRPFRTSRLTEPLTNIRIGMAYFADLLRQFGGVAQALAAYNAGEQRVARWVAERPGIARDEFIDDIPFPETQNYVKRILGTAEDYRGLYRSRSH